MQYELTPKMQGYNTENKRILFAYLAYKYCIYVREDKSYYEMKGKRPEDNLPVLYGSDMLYNNFYNRFRLTLYGWNSKTSGIIHHIMAWGETSGYKCEPGYSSWHWIKERNDLSIPTKQVYIYCRPKQTIYLDQPCLVSAD